MDNTKEKIKQAISMMASCARDLDECGLSITWSGVDAWCEIDTLENATVYKDTITFTWSMDQNDHILFKKSLQELMEERRSRNDEH